mmetsp:Transcript_8083/g.20420  ORF Transcript_8083/g.20420 Transcript_8083/m.20420 type:complete len:235 (-) Transcript_8083:2177-2881(-)
MTHKYTHTRDHQQRQTPQATAVKPRQTKKYKFGTIVGCLYLRDGGAEGGLGVGQLLDVHLQHGAGLEAADVVVVRDEDVGLLEHLQHLHGLAVELVRDLLAQLQVALAPEGDLAVVPLARHAHLEEHRGVLDGHHLVVARLAPPRVVDHLRGVVGRHDARLLQLREEAHLERLGPQLGRLAGPPRHLQVHAQQEAVLHVVDHLHLGLVPLPLGGVALHPRHLLVGVQRVRVAVL